MRVFRFCAICSDNPIGRSLMEAQMDRARNARLGILMLDTRFPRFPGDVGHRESWPFPVRYRSVPGATPQVIVETDPEPFVEAFIAAGAELVAEGCQGIATTCGFLAPLRPRLARALGVPVASSALEQAAQIRATLPSDRCLGILTISRSSVSPELMAVAGVPENSVVAGLDGTGFARSILGNSDRLDFDLARREMVAAACEMVDASPSIGAILLECTNMPPYAAEIARTTGRPVYSIWTYLRWFHEALEPQVFPKP